MINNDNIVEQILDKVDILDHIGEDVKLKLSGRNYFGCCPIHKEKTPSFCVTPARGLFYCYGCHKGGNVINYEMLRNGYGFKEAIKKLATQYNIEYIEKQKSAEETQRDLKHEAMQLANQQAQELFTDEILKSEEAKSYIEKRWGLNEAMSLGIGYIGKGNKLTHYVAEKKLNKSIFEELGLIRHNEERDEDYDFFRNRITIPIRKANGKIIGFSCRDISGDAEQKYLNSTTSELFDKKRTLYGLDIARRASIIKDNIYVVEGAPDAIRLHLIGVENAVAILGGVLSEEHVQVLRRATRGKNVCFIPDQDTSRDGMKFAPGTKNMIDAGLLCLRKGFNVTIKEIPVSDDGQKRDCDSFITNKSIFERLGEEDYVLWYARKVYEKDKDTLQADRYVKEIADIVALIDDEVKVQVYLKQLTEYVPGMQLWKTALRGARKAKAESEDSKKKKIDRSSFYEYGFLVRDNSYYGLDEKGEERQWSNFTLEPMYHIKDSINPKRLYKITNTSNITEIVELKMDDLVTLSKFKQRVEGMGNYIWEASMTELTKLKKYLYEKTETASEIIQMGHQRDGFYAFGNGAYFDGKFIKSDEYGIIRLPNGNNYYVPAASKLYANEPGLFQYERNFVHLTYSNETIYSITDQIEKVYGENGKIGLAFYFASLFKDIIKQKAQVPILNMFGPPQTGKSTLGHTLMHFFKIDDLPPNITTGTRAALAFAISQCSNALVHLDEFKNDLDKEKRELLKALWDGGGRSRMNMDKDKRMEMMRVDSCIMISGQEMATADAALFTRLLFLRFSKTQYSEDEQREYNKMVQMQKMGMTHITLQLLDLRDVVEVRFGEVYDQSYKRLYESLGSKADARMIQNWNVLLAMHTIIDSVYHLKAMQGLEEVIIRNMSTQKETMSHSSELATFWDAIHVLNQQGEISQESDFHIKQVSKLKIDGEEVEYLQPKRILFLRPSKAFALYTKQASIGENVPLPKSSLKYYLETSKEYLGIQKSVRYKVIIKGQEMVKRVDHTTGSRLENQYQIDRAMLFDYDLLRDNFDISLESMTRLESYQEEEED